MEETKSKKDALPANKASAKEPKFLSKFLTNSFGAPKDHKADADDFSIFVNAVLNSEIAAGTIIYKRKANKPKTKIK